MPNPMSNDPTLAVHFRRMFGEPKDVGPEFGPMIDDLAKAQACHDRLIDQMVFMVSQIEALKGLEDQYPEAHIRQLIPQLELTANIFLVEAQGVEATCYLRLAKLLRFIAWMVTENADDDELRRAKEMTDAREGACNAIP
jgi:hypothetical protein